MNKNIIFCLLMFSAVLFFSCSKEKPEYKPQDNVNIPKTDGPLKFTNNVVQKTYNNCTAGTENCTYIKLEYIEAAEGKGKDKINALINKELLFAYDMPDRSFKNTEEMMSAFMRDYETFRKEVPAAPQVWTIDLVIKTYSETDKVLCIGEVLNSYLGGAHPNSVKAYFNINKENGDTVTLAGLLRPGFETKLNALIDKKYRENKRLKPGDNLATKGDLFENEIKFNYNFIVTKDKGLDFVYNPYEIAPYALGPIIIKLSRAELDDIIAPESLIK